MRVTPITFNGYPAGLTDFSTLLTTVPQPEFGVLEDILQITAGQVASPAPNLHVSLIVVGHADRQDRTDFTCDQRRTSEIEAARDRAVSAWEFIKQEVNALVVKAGGVESQWWEDSPRITWALVFAAAGMLVHDPPKGEGERALNRRVMVLASVFSPDA